MEGPSAEPSPPLRRSSPRRQNGPTRPNGPPPSKSRSSAPSPSVPQSTASGSGGGGGGSGARGAHSSPNVAGPGAGTAATQEQLPSTGSVAPVGQAAGFESGGGGGGDAVRSARRPAQRSNSTSNKRARTSSSPGIKGEEAHISQAKQTLRRQLAAPPSREGIIGRSEQLEAMRGFLERLLSSNENISLLLQGERGTGKSLVLRTAVRELRERHPGQELTEVYVNSNTVADDTSAVREIARQLHRAHGDEEAATGGAAGGGAAWSGGGGGKAPRTFAQSMAELRSALIKSVSSSCAGGARGSTAAAGGWRGRPIILVLDEFERFAMGSGPRQMLLYNLFNLIHDAGSRVAVVGITCTYDALDHLEKRVK
jgi:hypothetical protein